MSELELLLREIEDRPTRENFNRLQKFLDSQVILEGNWRLYEIRFDAAATNFKYAHNLKFVPQDVIVLQVIGDRNVEFNHDKFDRTHIDITVKGACFVRFLAGRYLERILAPDARLNLTNVSVGIPGGSVGPLSEVIHTMDCDASLAVNDWVHQSATISNRAVKTSSWSEVEPTIGLVKSKPTATTAEVLLLGLYTGLTLPAGRGRIFLGSAGTASFSWPTSGTGAFVRQLGIAFGNGTIYVNPNFMGLELDDG